MKAINQLSMLALLFSVLACSSSSVDNNGLYQIKNMTGIMEESYHIKEDGKGNYRLDGEYKEWYSNGIPKVVGQFRLGKKEGEWKSWDNDGTQSEWNNYESDTLHGVHKGFFNKLGTLATEGNYTHGKKSGTWKEYDYKGKVLFQYEYNAGVNQTLISKPWSGSDGQTYTFDAKTLTIAGSNGNTQFGYSFSDGRSPNLYVERGGSLQVKALRNDSLYLKGNAYNAKGFQQDVVLVRKDK